MFLRKLRVSNIELSRGSTKQSACQPRSADHGMSNIGNHGDGRESRHARTSIPSGSSSALSRRRS